jgi:putative transposase
MKINKAYKFRIYPNQKQQDIFEQYFGVSRFVYNSVLAYKIDSYKKGIKYSAYDAIKDFTEVKKLDGYEWLKDVNSQVIQQSILNLDNAFQQFFKVEQSGFPKFKGKRNNHNSFRVPQHFQIDFENKKIKLPKINWIKFKDKRIFDSKIKSMTISKNPSNQYFVSILVEEEFEQNLLNEITESKVFSADMSAKNFLVSPDMEFENQKFYRKNERRLKIRQRRLSRKQKDSNNRKKERLNVVRFHRKIVNRRKGFQWNLAHELTQRFDALIFEDLNMRGMQQFNKGLSKTVTLDFSFSEFLSNLEWKCFKGNKHFVKIGRWFPSSKLCSSCGQIKQDLQLSDRQYICECGLNIDRDINASINIKNAGLNILKEKGINLLKNSTELNILESYACRYMSEEASNSAQESSSFRSW